MTSHTGRLYAAAAGLLTFFVLWAGIAAHPWRSTATATDPRLVALAQRDRLLRREAGLVRQIVHQRAAAAKAVAANRARQAAAAAAAPAASPVRIVTLPPLVITRTS
jgi:hypothetical protein